MFLARYKNLLRSAGFQSFLWTQFLGAFNDNVYKIALSMFAVTMYSATGGAGTYVAIAGAVFILPFFIFSGYAGYLADVYNKRSVLIVTKSFEILAVTWGLFAFVSGRIELMFVGLFLMAAHSTFFSPAKYGILPEMLPAAELSTANGLLEMTTFLAIILGTSVGTIMYSAWKGTPGLLGASLIVIAIAGTAMSFGIPGVQPSGSRKNFKFNPLSEIIIGFSVIRKQRILLITVVAITYFWFIGALLQMDLLLLGKEVMGLSDLRIGLMITFMAVGIGLGSIFAGRLSGEKIEPGLTPMGSIGMGVFSILLSLTTSSYALTAFALTMVGFSGGLFIVPLNALLQQKSGREEKGRIIATSNFISTAGILASSAALWIFKDILHISADRIILIFGLLTIAFTAYITRMLPDFLVRFALFLLTHTMYKIRVVGRENIPQRGPALLVSNHMSFVDGLLVGACMQRFIRFMVYRYFYELRHLNWFMRLMKVIPVSDGGRKDVFEALAKAREELKSGHVVCIFAEGAISRTGNLQPFKKGVERISESLDVPVIPVHIDRVWGSVFSFKRGKFFWKLPERFPHPVTVSFGRPLTSTATANDLRHEVMELSSISMGHRISDKDLLHLRFIKAAKKRFFSPCLADSSGRALTYGQTLAGCLVLSSWLKNNRKGERFIGIMLPASAAGVVANIGALMAGHTPVNLNFTGGREALDCAVRQCGIGTILTSRLFLSRARLEEMEGMVFLEDISRVSATPFKKALKYISALILPSGLISALLCKGKKDSGRLAAVIFTSGSMGEPKGVMLTHKNILSNIEGLAQIFPLTKKDTLMGILPFFHSFGFTGTIWFPLLSGLKAVYHGNPLDAKTVGEMVGKHRATIIMGTPTFYSAYAAKCASEQFSSLRFAIAGAEKLREPVARAFREKFGIDLLEGYGCTEMSPVVSVNSPDILHGEIRQEGNKPGTVGRAIPGVAVKAVDPVTGERVPDGEEGLLLVKGHSLMAGYLGQGAKTSEVIRDGWYITGDIASIGEDGFIRIVDRVSRFSKIGGETTPHIKIEETLSELLGGVECAVTAVPDPHKGERLVAFYCCEGIEAHDIWKGLQSTGLPKLWIPKRENIYRIDAIPVTPAGKTDLRKIKELALEFSGLPSGAETAVGFKGRL